MDEVFKALGDTTRLRIVSMLAAEGEMCVCRIMEELGMGQSAVSHHMGTLKHAGLLNARRQGQWIHYSLKTNVIEDGPLSFLKQLAMTARSSEERERPLDGAELNASCRCPDERSSVS